MQRGFTFLEVVISVTLLLIIVVGGYQGYAAVHSAIAHAHYRMTALDLANERFEVIKNLSYTSVGTVGGTPSGVTPSSETIIRGSVNYLIETSIQNVNDPFDGIPDSSPDDYKLIEVRVTCSSCKNFSPVVITGRVSPLAAES